MTNIQRAFCVFLSLIFLCVVAALTGDFFKHGEIYRQLPLYCFLEKKALQEETGRDRETEMLLKEKNEEHLGEEVEAENRKEQEALLMAEVEEAEKKEEKQKRKCRSQRRNLLTVQKIRRIPVWKIKNRKLRNRKLPRWRSLRRALMRQKRKLPSKKR